MPTRIALTLDLDWAPDFAIDWVRQELGARGVAATLFVTHQSEAVARLAGNPLFELGIHPNFFAGSSHGSTPQEVLEHVMELVPGAQTMRTHGLMQSTNLFAAALKHTPVQNDSSTIMFRSQVKGPFWHHWAGKQLLRFPFIWEDDYEMESAEPRWDLDGFQLGAPERGMAIFNFHPIHLVLNSATMEGYGAIKEQFADLRSATAEAIETHKNAGVGTQTLFMELLDHLEQQPSHTIAGLRELYLADS